MAPKLANTEIGEIPLVPKLSDIWCRSSRTKPIDDFAKAYLHSGSAGDSPGHARQARRARRVHHPAAPGRDRNEPPRPGQTPVNLGVPVLRRGLRAAGVTEHETRDEIVDRYHRVWEHSDGTITALAIDAPGYVPWWPSPNVTLFNVLVHMLTETSRHAGHADILREQLDGSTGTAVGPVNLQRDAAFWEARRAAIERAAAAADPTNADQTVQSPQTSDIDVPGRSSAA